MLDFKPLASSSDGCSYLVGCGTHPGLIVDAGLSFDTIQKATGFRISALAGALISHAHGDHSKAVPALLKAGVDVYASDATWKALDPIGRLFGHRAHTVSEHEEFEVGPWKVKPFEAVHDLDGTLGFLVGSPDGDRLLYLTDTAYSKFKFEGLTHIAVEANYSREILRENTIAGRINLQRGRRTSCTHLSLERLIAMLQANDLSKVQAIWLLHLSDANSDEDAFRLAVQQATGRPVYIAPKNAVTNG